MEAIEPHEGRPEDGETSVGCYMRVHPERADVDFLGSENEATRCVRLTQAWKNPLEEVPLAV